MTQLKPALVCVGCGAPRSDGDPPGRVHELFCDECQGKTFDKTAPPSTHNAAEFEQVERAVHIADQAYLMVGMGMSLLLYSALWSLQANYDFVTYLLAGCFLGDVCATAITAMLDLGLRRRTIALESMFFLCVGWTLTHLDMIAMPSTAGDQAIMAIGLLITAKLKVSRSLWKIVQE